MRFGANLRVAAALAAFCVVACGDSGGSSTADGGSSGNNNGSNTGTTGASSGGGSSSSGGTRSPTGQCMSTSMSQCTQKEQDDYSSCVTTKCDTEYKACLGDDYKTGKFGGPCKTYFECVNACPCNDSSCAQKCGQPPSDCTNCLTTAGNCATSKCPLPACYTSGTGLGDGGLVSSGKTCADLATCCSKIQDANQKSGCDQIVSSKQDLACGVAYTTFSSLCK